MAMTGADSERLIELAAQLDAAAQQFEQSSRGLRGTLYNVVWKGRFADEFRMTWDGRHMPSLQTTSTFLRDAARSLRTNAEQQREASGGGTGSMARSGEWVFSGTLGARMAPGLGVGFESLSKAIGLGSLAAGSAELLRGAIKGDFAGDFSAAGLSKFDAGVAKSGVIGKIGAAASIVSIGVDGVALGAAIGAGDSDQAIRSGISVAWTLGGTAVPVVGEMKAAWDAGWMVGEGIAWVDQHTLDVGGRLNDAAISNVVASKYGGELSASEATDLGHRYDGPGGFVNWVGDSGKGAADSVSGFFKKIF